MHTLRLGTGAAALAVSSMVAFSVAGPALAQQGPKPPGHNCPNPAGKYPPGQCKKAGITPPTGRNGTSFTAQSGSEFDPNSPVSVRIESTPQSLGTVQADDTGNASITFTASALETGGHVVIFRGTLAGASGREIAVPFRILTDTAVQGTTTDRGQGAGGAPSSLPFTGSDDLIPLTVAGAGLVLVGAGVVVAARRRRTESPGGIA